MTKDSRPIRDRRRLSGGALGPLFAAALLGASAAAALRAEGNSVVVPGGPAAIRRLFAIDSGRPDSEFFLELHEYLLFGAPEDASWSRVVSRRKAAAFADDLADWRRRFGSPARFSAEPEPAFRRLQSALEWMGFRVGGRGRSFEVQRLDDTTSARRQSFPDVLGTPTSRFLAELREGREVSIVAESAAVPLPFGLEAWRETVSARDLTADNAFLYFLGNPRASRLLVALQALDPATRDALRALPRGPSGRVNGWKILYDRSLDAFCRYPEDLELSGGRFVLPGGPSADPIWTDVFGVAPTEPAGFLEAFYAKDGGKAAYVVDSLRRIRDSEALALLRPEGLAADEAVRRFRRIYASIDPTGENYRRTRRDPYDFAHLISIRDAWGKGPVALPAGDPRETAFPRDEEALSALVAAQGAAAVPYDEFLRRLFEKETPGVSGSFPAQRRFVFLESLLARHPSLAEPGLVVLLYRGSERFLPAYSLFDDAPFLRPEIARRYLFTLDRLARRKDSRESELAAGLFQGSAAVLGLLSRARGLDAAPAEELLAALLALPLFAREDVSPGEGEAALYAWLSGRLLPALGPEISATDARDPDETLAAAAVGRPGAAVFEWRGGRYRFDPAEDELARRRRFRERQRLTWVADLEPLHRARDAALAAAASGNLAEARARAAELAEGLGLAEEKATSGSGEDERIAKEEERAREAAARIASLASPAALGRVPELLASLDTVLAERHLEALLGHVYAAGARDPDDLYYQDPSFVRRHSFRTVSKGGATLRTAFTPPQLVSAGAGGGSRIEGSLFGLTAVLGLLHADQLAYGPGGRPPNEEVRIGLIAPIWEMSVARLDDGALEAVAASSRATRAHAASLAASSYADRLAAWSAVARDLVSQARLGCLASLEEANEESLSRCLSPSDFDRIGRRLARDGAPSAAETREALGRLESRAGGWSAGDVLAEFGPRPAAFAGCFRLADLDMPPYERLAAYRRPEMFAERLYDLKIAVALRVAEEGLPAALLPVVLPAALDELLVRVRMAFAYDWGATVRGAAAFSREDLARILDRAVDSGRLVREENTGSDIGGGS